MKLSNLACLKNLTKYVIHNSKRYQHHVNAHMLEVDVCKGQGN